MNAQDLQDLLKELQSLPECEWIEFKVDNYNPQEIGEYLSAISNSACYHTKDYGYLVFGIEDQTHRLIGTSFKPKTEKKGNQELENWLATQLNPRIDFSIYEFDYDDKHFALFQIEATKRTPVSFRGVPFIRVGSYKKPLDDHPEKERKIWVRDNQEIYERQIAKVNLSDLTILELIDYTGYFELIRFPLPDNREGIIERLVQDKIIVKRNSSKYDITNLGAILFAKEIESFDDLSRKALRVIFYDGNNRIKTKREQIGKRGYAVGFEGLIRYISDLLPTKEVIEGAFRKDVPSYPILAIRELVANAIIHQDFSSTGTSPMIEIFDNRIEVQNPGKPLIDPLRFVDHSPQSRNEIIARTMRRLNICEERGSGIDKVVHECEMYELPAHETIVGDNFTRIILYGWKPVSQLDKKEKIRACYLHSCLKYVSGEYMTNQSLRDRFRIKESNYPIASRIISDTIEAGLVKDYDPENKSRKYAKYVPYWV